MNITNKNGLPDYVVRAVETSFGEYNAGDCDVSVTGLLEPHYLGKLKRDNREGIEGQDTDVDVLLPAFMGSAVHTILEKGVIDTDVSEKRYFTEFNGYKLSGQIDHLSAGGVLTDNKTCTTYAILEHNDILPTESWIMQLNIYKWMIERETDRKISKLQIMAFIKDWSLATYERAESKGDVYPAGRGIVIPVPILPDMDTVVKKLLDDHFSDNPEPCTKDERWAKNKKPWAVVKKLGGRATKLFEVCDEANTFAETNGGIVEHRDPEYRRCRYFCPVSQFCEQFNGEKP